jgi:hypothetical protein
MKNRDLIKLLQALPPDEDVVVQTEGDETDVTSVELVDENRPPLFGTEPVHCRWIRINR